MYIKYELTPAFRQDNEASRFDYLTFFPGRLTAEEQGILEEYAFTFLHLRPEDLQRDEPLELQLFTPGISRGPKGGAPGIYMTAAVYDGWMTLSEAVKEMEKALALRQVLETSKLPMAVEEWKRERVAAQGDGIYNDSVARQGRLKRELAAALAASVWAKKQRMSRLNMNGEGFEATTYIVTLLNAKVVALETELTAINAMGHEKETAE